MLIRPCYVLEFTANRSQVKTKQDDLVIYEPFFNNGLCFRKAYNTVLPGVNLTEEKASHGPLVKIDDVSGYGVAFMPGESPCFVMKTSKSLPKLYRLQGETVRSLSAFHTKETERGFLYIDVKVKKPI